jgi:murein DD-endopeptidase MepM/ murein hydrolase activator NlpD
LLFLLILSALMLPGAVPAALADEAVPSTSRVDPSVTAPVASAFVYPIGDELDFQKAAPGEPNGYHISDPYLALRKGRRHGPGRVHYGCDFSAGQAGLPVRAIAAGVVEVSDGNALVKTRTARQVKVSKLVKGKRVYRTVTRYRTTWKWKTGWGNRVVIRHTLPGGQVVYSLYAHLLSKSVLVREGDVVSAGQPIARVGRTGRATAPHLHLEIRTSKLDEREAGTNPDDSSAEDEGDSGEETDTSSPHTVDPVAFLADHVIKLEDLEPGTWEARYALAAVEDGVMSADKDHFQPDHEVTRGEFYGALVAAFHLGTPFTNARYESSVDALVDTGILSDSTRSHEDEDDRVTRSEALDLVLRCLDHGMARGLSMSRLSADQLARDFNVCFAGKDATAEAERDARRLADTQTAALRKVAEARAAQRAKAARERGVRPPKRRPVVPVKPMPMLDPGYQSLVHSDKKLSRAETCLLLASALRMGSSNLSALERAATHVAKTG